MNEPINVYGVTKYYENGILKCTYDGYGYRDSTGNIIWYGGYNPPDIIDKNHDTIIVPYDRNKSVSVDNIDIIIEEFCQIINDNYYYRDMLSFNEIQNIFECMKKIRA